MSKRKKIPPPNPKKEQYTLPKPKLPQGYHRIYDSHSRDEKPSISLKYIDLNFKSFNDLKKGHKLKEFDNFLHKLGQFSDWDSVFTYFNRDDTNTKKCTKKMRSLGFNPKQTEMFHLRVSGVFRVHGFMSGERFKLIWLDPDHELNRE